MKADNEVNFLVFCQLHFKVLHTFKLLRLFFNREVLIFAYYAFCEVDHLISVCSRVEAVLWCDVDLSELLLKSSKALVIRCLFE